MLGDQPRRSNWKRKISLRGEFLGAAGFGVVSCADLTPASCFTQPFRMSEPFVTSRPPRATRFGQHLHLGEMKPLENPWALPEQAGNQAHKGKMVCGLKYQHSYSFPDLDKLVGGFGAILIVIRGRSHNVGTIHLF